MVGDGRRRRGDVAASNVAAVAVATLCNFLLNRSFTFRSGSNPIRSMVLYVALLAFNTAFSTFAIGWLVGVGAEPAVAKVLTQGCVVVWNYFLYNKVVFKLCNYYVRRQVTIRPRRTGLCAR